MPNGPDGDSSADGAASDHGNPADSPPAHWSWPRFWRNALLIATACGAIALSIWYGVEGVYPNLVPKNFGTVQPGVLYRSGELTPAATKQVVHAHGIRTIVDLGAHELGTPEEARAATTAEALGVNRLRIPLFGDGTGDPNRYVAALRVMTNPDAQPVLVHCAAGAQRTGCAVALFRDIIEAAEPDDAIAEASDYRHDPDKTPEMPDMFWTWRDEIERSFTTGEPIDYDGPSKK